MKQCFLSALLFFMLNGIHSAVFGQIKEFSQNEIFSFPSKYGGIEHFASTDIDNDGVSDLVVSYTHVDSIGVYIGDEDRPFPSSRHFYCKRKGGTLFFLDADQDLKLDLLLGNDSGFTLLKGDAKGQFSLLKDSSFLASGLSVVYFNNDFYPDIFYQQGTTLIVQGDRANAQFGPSLPIHTVQTGTEVSNVQIMDLDNNGKSDLFFSTSSDFIWLLGNGDSTFQQPHMISFPTKITSITAGDFNYDGYQDLIVVADYAYLLENNFSGTFKPAKQVSSENNLVTALISDVDADDRPDIVTLSDLRSNITVHLGNGDATFSPPYSYRTGNETTLPLHPGDFSECGRTNSFPNFIVSTCALGDTLPGQFSLLNSSGFGKFHSILNFLSEKEIGALGAADMNNDESLDILAVPVQEDSLFVYKAYGKGLYVPFSKFKTTQYPKDVVAGDFNRDTFEDIALATSSDTVLAVYLGNGKGNFTLKSKYVIQNGKGAAYIKKDDYNDDGLLDLMLNVSQRVYLCAGKGDGTFEAPTLLPNFGITEFITYFADLNNDNKLDIFGTDTDNGKLNYSLGKGGGIFDLSDYQELSVGTRPHFAVASDLDNDSYLDLVTANSGSQVDSENLGILINQGNVKGSFSPVSFFDVPDSLTVRTIISADFSGEGNQDLLCGDSVHAMIHLFHGTGTGNLLEQQSMRVWSNVKSLLSADFNNDGNPDLALSNPGFSILLGAQNKLVTSLARATNGTEQETSHVTCYPNPALEVVNIRTNELFVQGILFDMQGLEVLQSSKPSLNVSALPQGLYLLEIQTNKATTYHKLLKK